jgi:hypothetical protein
VERSPRSAHFKWCFDTHPKRMDTEASVNGLIVF